MVTLLKWSIADYHKLIETGILCDRRIELINGELVEMSPEGVIHAAYCGSIADYLRHIFNSQAWIREAHPIILNNSEPEPDIAIVKLPKSRYFQNHPTPQDIFWLIEISDTTLAYYLSQKKEIYARSNIPEYWVIDVKNKKLIIFTQPIDNNYAARLKLSEGSVKPILFPNMEISVAKLFEQ
jgi:Uma2 family endonuclease